MSADPPCERLVRRWSPARPGVISGRAAAGDGAALLFGCHTLIGAEVIEGGGLLLLCDHASNFVPAGIDLGVEPDVMERHVAIDIGAGPLSRALAERLDAPAIRGTVSRLVIELHRPPDHPHLIPEQSDGHEIAGNRGADRYARIAAFHAPYHRAIAARVRRQRPRLIVAIHSFTPRLETGGEPRPWHVGILYNRDDRAARQALAALAALGLTVGDNQPYSGRALNMTLNRHAEANGIPSLSIEVRNDLIADPAGIARWTNILAPILAGLVPR